uniref:Uncharacterized protein n=1 Tax=Fagus sylvatica TaxID=28930 RepID=A0A2N9GEW9_FAGSY
MFSSNFITLFWVLAFAMFLCKAKSQSIVETLPGFPGILPFKLETGYVGVGEVDEVQLFYYFIESEGNPKKDPLLLWLTGGPGCSAFSGLVYEIGPLTFNYEDFDGNLPTFLLNPYSWTKVASIIFLDAPVGTGFSYSRTSQGYNITDKLSAAQTYEFLRKPHVDCERERKDTPPVQPGAHPSAYSSDLNDTPPVRRLPAGASASQPRISTALLVKQSWRAGGTVEKHFGAEVDDQRPPHEGQRSPQWGYVLGNPVTDRRGDVNSQIEYSHRLALISDELYESVKESCHGEYVRVDPKNVQCLIDLEAVNECIGKLEPANILEPLCPLISPNSSGMDWNQVSLEEGPMDILLSWPQPHALWCRVSHYVLSYIWANDKTVQNALHIREGTILNWVRCNKTLSYTYDVISTVEYHRNLTKTNYRSLIYSGDHDLNVPYVGTQEWIRTLNMTVSDDWEPWFVEGQVAGEQVTQLQSTSLKNVLPWWKGGLPTTLSNLTAVAANLANNLISPPSTVSLGTRASKLPIEQPSQPLDRSSLDLQNPERSSSLEPPRALMRHWSSRMGCLRAAATFALQNTNLLRLRNSKTTPPFGVLSGRPIIWRWTRHHLKRPRASMRRSHLRKSIAHAPTAVRIF